MQTVHEFIDGDIPVLLEQRSNGAFKITYGAEITETKSYTDAVTEYGFCVFHSLACAGKLDNSHWD